MMDNLRIDTCLQEIGDRGYKPGLLAWLKRQPDRWARLLQLEAAINKATLSRDETGLTAALTGYQDFFREMVRAYEMSNTLPLFEAHGGLKP